jgi:hypothetical protein
MDLHQHLARHRSMMECLVAIGLLLPVSLVLADSPVTVNVPLGSDTFTPTVPSSFVIYCDKKLPFLKSHREKGQESVLEVR